MITILVVHPFHPNIPEWRDGVSRSKAPFMLSQLLSCRHVIDTLIDIAAVHLL